eukprot:TRINITY_DN7920_c0_g1_i6.p1 TRINITY_DN7920_c0_g1~~TRINITY_DN7920_c0_g1_i6.p1  ORF type:complete len:564 (+),score=160.36 TRINITY_DN7920_c0_g1_i6:773-2464(+)
MTPVVFDNENYSVANVVVHSSVLGYTFRPAPLYYSENEDFLRIVASKPATKRAMPFTASFRDLVFPAELTLAEFSKDYLEGIHSEFVGSLMKTYRFLEERIKIVSLKFSASEKDAASEAMPSFCTEEQKIALTKETETTHDVNEENEQKQWVESVQTCKSTEEVTASLQREMATQGAKLLKLWNQYLEAVINIPHVLCTMLLEGFNKARTEAFHPFFCTCKTKVATFPILLFDDKLPDHQKLAKVIRKSLCEKAVDNYALKDLGTFGNLDAMPIFFEDVFVRNAEIKESPSVIGTTGKGCLFVFVHGYLGSAYDTALMKDVIALRFPEAETLCTCDNEGHTEGDIEEMGQRLAREVVAYIRDWFPKGNLQHLSFIGHSLGGLIARAALPHLADYKSKMRVFMTFSTPHLGCMYQSSSLVGTGMWFLKKWKGSKSLAQLAMSEDKDMTKTVVYKLSEAEGLNWFKRVILFSSHQDFYSPYESSRIEVKRKYDSDSLKEYVYMKMAANMMGRLTADAVHRVDVGFNIKASNMNTFIGREAHLLFLTSETFLRMITYRYADLFVTS